MRIIDILVAGTLCGAEGYRVSGKASMGLRRLKSHEKPTIQPDDDLLARAKLE
jgi:hypothetical protein